MLTHIDDLTESLRVVTPPFHEIGQIFTGAQEMGFDMSIFRVDPPDYDPSWLICLVREFGAVDRVEDGLFVVGDRGRERLLGAVDRDRC